MNRVIYCTSGKGGVAKTFFASALAALMRELNVLVALIDGDGDVGQLRQYLGERSTDGKLLREQGAIGVQSFNFHSPAGDEAAMRAVFEALISPLKAYRGHVLLDLPAASLSVLAQFENEFSLASGIAKLGFRPTLVVPITPLLASRASVADALDMGKGYDVLAVRSAWWGDDGDYRIWLRSKLRERLFASGGKEIVMPRLRPYIVADLDEKNLSFLNGIEQLDWPDSETLKRWWADTKTMLLEASEWLGLDQGAPLALAGGNGK